MALLNPAWLPLAITFDGKWSLDDTEFAMKTYGSSADISTVCTRIISMVYGIDIANARSIVRDIEDTETQSGERFDRSFNMIGARSPM